MTVKVFYKASVRRDLRKINPNSVGWILREIRNVLADNPNCLFASRERVVTTG